MKYQRLFQPITVNGMTLKNRIVMTAAHLCFSDDGGCNDRINAFYWTRAEGGISMAIIGGVATDSYVGYPNMLRIDDDKFIPSYKKFTDGMHERGAKVCIQLMQTGRYGHAEFVECDTNTISASSVPSRISADLSRPMTKDEIKTVIDNAAKAALRAKKSGFDAVELTAASGYMIAQYLSPVTNLRTDEYGGCEENRMRFGLEMISAVREAIGPDFPLFVRVAGNEFVKGGNDNEFCIRFCKKLEEHGVDLINVTGGWHETIVPQLTGEVPLGGFSYLSQAIKEAVHIPVLSANRHNDPDDCELTLALGQADIIGQCRTQIADPDWARKTKEGKIKEIRHCVACNQGCFSRVFFYSPCACLVNGDAGLEYQRKESTLEKPKNLLVIGAGPAGCEFSYRAARKGHHVTIWEKNDHIGGQLPYVAAPPSKYEFRHLPTFYQSMLEKYHVSVELNQEASIDQIKRHNFDAVIVAAGSTPKKLAFNHIHHLPVYTAEDILAGRVIAGKQIVIIGGGSVGCETAQYLAHEATLSPEKFHFMVTEKVENQEKIMGLSQKNNRNITIIDTAKIGAGFDKGCSWSLMIDLKRLKVDQYSFASDIQVSEQSVAFDAPNRKTKELEHHEADCDTLIMAVGYSSNNTIYDQLKENNISAYNIGDSNKTGKILDAIRQAADLAETI